MGCSGEEEEAEAPPLSLNCLADFIRMDSASFAGGAAICVNSYARACGVRLEMELVNRGSTSVVPRLVKAFVLGLDVMIDSAFQMPCQGLHALTPAREAAWLHLGFGSRLGRQGRPSRQSKGPRSRVAPSFAHRRGLCHCRAEP